MSANYVKSIHAEGVFGKYDFSQTFEEGINIIHGINGAGKTTLLHILANALNGDFERFKFFEFNKINILLSNNQSLIISKGNSEEILVSLNNQGPYPVDQLPPIIDFLDVVNKYPLDLSIKNKLSDGINFPKRVDDKDIASVNDIVLSYLYMFKTQGILSDQSSSDLFFEFKKRRETLKLINPNIPTAYFPAFRTMIEAWAATNLAKDPRGSRIPPRTITEEWRGEATKMARDWFGEFTPLITFPSLIDIEDQLSSEINSARIAVGTRDRNQLYEAFNDVFKSLSDHTQILEDSKSVLKQILIHIKELENLPMGFTITPFYKTLKNEMDNIRSKEVEESATRILIIYRDMLISSIENQKSALANINNYQSSVNEFFETSNSADKKSLTYKLDDSQKLQSMIGIQYSDGSYKSGLRTLSSGERQIITLLYASSHMSEQRVVLIDEPEISLHIDWQRKLLSNMAKHIGDKQIIACTHSPVIAADYEGQLKEFQFKLTKSKPKKASGKTGDEKD